MNPRDKLIVALDVSTAAAARSAAAAIGDSASTYKVGMQLYTAAGPDMVRELIASSRRVFLDLKYHDIPNTVASTVREAATLGVGMLTVHAMGGGRMLHAAVGASREASSPVKVLAVTVLTSMAEADLAQTGVSGKVQDQVLRLAELAINEGCDGVVASAHEAKELRRRFGNDFMIVTPGIRPPGAAHGDQARVVTPKEAIEAGATHIVVGRPILGAADPSQAARDVLSGIS